MRKLHLTHTGHVSQGSCVPPDSQTHSCSLTLTVAFFLSFVYLFVGSSTEERGGKGKCLVLLLNISTVLSDDPWEVAVTQPKLLGDYDFRVSSERVSWFNFFLLLFFFSYLFSKYFLKIYCS